MKGRIPWNNNKWQEKKAGCLHRFGRPWHQFNDLFLWWYKMCVSLDQKGKTMMSLLSPPKNESCSLISMEFFWNNRLGRASIKSVTTTRFAGENILAGSKQIVQNNQVICCIVHQMLFIITSCYQGIIIRKYWMSMPTLILWGFNTIYLFNFVVKGRACSLINLIDYLNALQTASVRA